MLPPDFQRCNNFFPIAWRLKKSLTSHAHRLLKPPELSYQMRAFFGLGMSGIGRKELACRLRYELVINLLLEAVAGYS
jgi:hypothetical protein